MRARQAQIASRFGVGPVGVVVDVLDFEFGPAFGLEQTFDFDANPNLTLLFDRAVDVNGVFTSQVTVDARTAPDLQRHKRNCKIVASAVLTFHKLQHVPSMSLDRLG